MSKLDDVMGLPAIIPDEILPPEPRSVNAEIVDPNQTQAEEDFATVRKNLQGAADIGQKVLEDMAEFIRDAPSGKAFEVFSEILRSVGETQEKLLEIHKKRKEIGSQKGKQPNSVTNNNVFVGSTKELQDAMKIINGNPK